MAFILENGGIVSDEQIFEYEGFKSKASILVEKTQITLVKAQEKILKKALETVRNVQSVKEFFAKQTAKEFTFDDFEKLADKIPNPVFKLVAKAILAKVNIAVTVGIDGFDSQLLRFTITSKKTEANASITFKFSGFKRITAIELKASNKEDIDTYINSITSIQSVDTKEKSISSSNEYSSIEDFNSKTKANLPLGIPGVIVKFSILVETSQKVVTLTISKGVSPNLKTITRLIRIKGFV